jgi:hypothetical protein
MCALGLRVRAVLMEYRYRLSRFKRTGAQGKT